LIEALAQSEQKLINLYIGMKKSPELMKILEVKDFSRIEKKLAATNASFNKR